MQVCTAWCVHVKDCELWRDIAIGEDIDRLRWRTLAGAPSGVPRLLDRQLDAMLSHADGHLRTLTLVNVTSITSCAFYALRASPLLESVTVMGCPLVCNNIALALPRSGRVHTLALGCAKVNGLIAQMLPPTIRTLRLTGSGVRTSDVRPLQPPRSGLDVDLTICAGCDAPAPKDEITTCSRCSLIGCNCRALPPSSDGTVKWTQSGCDTTAVCSSCGEGRLCSECDDRAECDVCEHERICDDCLESTSRRCAGCDRLCCDDCTEHRCDGCDALFCCACDDEDDTFSVVAKLCAITGKRLCPDCQPSTGQTDHVQGKCDDCHAFVGITHGVACACAESGCSEFAMLCTRCVPRGRRCWSEESILYRRRRMTDVCASADCTAVICQRCSSSCAVCDTAFCGECATSVDDSATPHSDGERARLCAMGFQRPFACAECGKMYCADCEEQRTCSFCGLVSCATCERVRVCDGCDQSVCRFCDEAERMGTCCSLTAGWLGEEVHLSSTQVVTDAVGDAFGSFLHLGSAWGCRPTPSSAHTCPRNGNNEFLCGFACAECDASAASLRAHHTRMHVDSRRPGIAMCERERQRAQGSVSLQRLRDLPHGRESAWCLAYDEHAQEISRARKTLKTLKAAKKEHAAEEHSCSVCTFQHSASARHCPRCGSATPVRIRDVHKGRLAVARGILQRALMPRPELDNLPDFSLTRVRLLCSVHTSSRLCVLPPKDGYVDVCKEVTRRVPGQLHWQSEWVLAARLPLTQLNRFVQYRPEEWTVRLLGPARLRVRGEGTSPLVPPTHRKPLRSDEVRIHLQPPSQGSLWPIRRAGKP